MNGVGCSAFADVGRLGRIGLLCTSYQPFVTAGPNPRPIYRLICSMLAISIAVVIATKQFQI